MCFRAARKGDKLTDYTASQEASNSALPSGPSSPILATHVTRWQSWQVRGKLPFSGSQPPGLPFSTGKMVFPPVSSVKHKTCSPNQQQPQWLWTAWDFMRRKEQQVKLFSTGVTTVKLPLNSCCWKTSPDQEQRPKQGAQKKPSLTFP